MLSKNTTFPQKPLSSSFDDHMIGHSTPDTGVSILYKDNQTPHGFSFRRNQIEYVLRFDPVEGSIIASGKQTPMNTLQAIFALGTVELELSSANHEKFKAELAKLSILKTQSSVISSSKPRVQ